ncbi:MAG: hypothetical protein WCK08_07195 [Betaproteobacteria bacterium]
MNTSRPWLRALLALLRWPLALVLVFEEWGWESLQRLLASLGRWPGFRWLEDRIERLPPYGALALFLLPTLLLLPLKLTALWLIGQGHALWGALLIIGAKLVGTAIVARLFTLTQPALMQLPWFARLYARWTAWKNGLLAWVRASGVWRAARLLKAQVKRLLRSFSGQR